MGGFCSRLCSFLRGYVPAATSELQATAPGDSRSPVGSGRTTQVQHATDLELGPTPTRPAAVEVTLSDEMSSPTASIDPEDRCTVSGHGLALAGAPVPPGGAAYWEWHVTTGCGGPDSSSAMAASSGDDEKKKEGEAAVMFGVSTKRTPAFYKILAKADGAASSLKLATKEMRPLVTYTGDVVGVAIDLAPAEGGGGDKKNKKKPIVQLRLNGELMEEYKLGLVRGNVFPSVWLPPPDGTSGVIFAAKEEELVQQSPAAKFMPLGVGTAGGGGTIV